MPTQILWSERYSYLPWHLSVKNEVLYTWGPPLEVPWLVLHPETGELEKCWVRCFRKIAQETARDRREIMIEELGKDPPDWQKVYLYMQRYGMWFRGEPVHSRTRLNRRIKHSPYRPAVCEFSRRLYIPEIGELTRRRRLGNVAPMEVVVPLEASILLAEEENRTGVARCQIIEKALKAYIGGNTDA